MARKVERKGTKIWILDDETGRVAWNGRTDSYPPDCIRYLENGVEKTIAVDQSNDLELLHAVERLLNPTTATES